jgi:hypothetical protein
MKESFAHYYIYGKPNFNGTVHGIEFKGGQAYLNTREFGEEESRVVLDKLSREGYLIQEITTNESPEGVRDPNLGKRAIEEPDKPKKPALK